MRVMPSRMETRVLVVRVRDGKMTWFACSRELERRAKNDGRNFELWTNRDEGAEAARDCAAGFLVSTMPRV